MPQLWSLLTSPDFLVAFGSALQAMVKVFLMGVAGFLAINRRWIKPEGLVPVAQIIACITLPAQVFQRFAHDFSPQAFPGWWKLVLISLAITAGCVVLGRITGRRHRNEEATLLVGFQNAGFFVLPMMQALLPAGEFQRASVLLFIFVIPFNACIWPVASWLLLHKREFNPRALISPVTISVTASLLAFGVFHEQTHLMESTFLWEILLGGERPGAVQLIGDLTVPLATMVLGGSIAATLGQSEGGWLNLQYKRASLEVAAMKLLLVPLLGYVVLRGFGGISLAADPTLALLLMLEFAAPPAINIAVFCQQHGYDMKLIPTASLLSYLLSLLTVPFWVALIR